MHDTTNFLNSSPVGRTSRTHHLSGPFVSNIRRLSAVGESMGTANASASARMSESPVTRASARPASANSRNGLSRASRHSGIAGWWNGNVDGLAIGKVVVEQVALIVGVQRELGIGEDPNQLRRRLPADKWTDAAFAPGPAQPGKRSGMEEQRRYRNVRIQNRTDRRHSPDRAQATASFTSVSESPSSASFARTPSARLTRTGVSTMRPFSVVTSK